MTKSVCALTTVPHYVVASASVHEYRCTKATVLLISCTGMCTIDFVPVYSYRFLSDFDVIIFLIKSEFLFDINEVNTINALTTKIMPPTVTKAQFEIHTITRHTSVLVLFLVL